MRPNCGETTKRDGIKGLDEALSRLRKSDSQGEPKGLKLES